MGIGQVPVLGQPDPIACLLSAHPLQCIRFNPMILCDGEVCQLTKYIVAKKSLLNLSLIFSALSSRLTISAGIRNM